MAFRTRGRRQHRTTQSERERTRLAIKFLADTEHRRVCRTNCKKEEGKGQWLGMEAGIAMKPGNAGGVKVSTAFNRGWTNICYTQR